MKIVTLLVLFLFTSLLIPPPEHVDARAKSYPLMCRGGGAMKGKISNWYIELEFQGAKQGAHVRPPQPGECAWLDRGFLPGEPQVFYWFPKPITSYNMDYEHNRITKLNSGNNQFEYVVNGLLNQTGFQVHAYRGECPGPQCNGLYVTEVR